MQRYAAKKKMAFHLCCAATQLSKLLYWYHQTISIRKDHDQHLVIQIGHHYCCCSTHHPAKETDIENLNVLYENSSRLYVLGSIAAVLKQEALICLWLILNLQLNCSNLFVSINVGPLTHARNEALRRKP